MRPALNHFFVRIAKSLARWSVIAIACVLVLELLCHMVQLSNDSTPVDYIADPHVAYRMAPGSSGSSAFGIPYRINAAGLRNKEIAMPKPPGVFRVLVLGDSITLGYGLPEDSAYPRVLERLIGSERVEVINAGAVGYHVQDFVAYLEHYGRQLEPDLVVCAFTHSDVDPPQKLVIRGGVGYEATDNVRVIPPFAKKVLRRSRLYLAIGRARWAMGSKPREPSEEARNAAFAKVWPDVQKNLRRLGELCEERHIPLLMPYLPVQLETFNGVEYPALLERFATLDLPNYKFVNLQPLFAGEKQTQLFLPMDPAHPNARGHAMIARAIADEPFFRQALPAGTKLTLR
jgi:lysophospholipase L1-like esterase